MQDQHIHCITAGAITAILANIVDVNVSIRSDKGDLTETECLFGFIYRTAVV